MIIVFLLAALQAFFLVSLLLAKRTKSMADNVLLVWLAGIGTHTSIYYLHFQFGLSVPLLLNLNAAFPFLQGPFLLAYIAALIGMRERPEPVDYLHLLPFAAFVIFVVASQWPVGLTAGQSQNVVTVDIFSLSAILTIALFISVPIYVVWSLLIMRRADRALAPGSLPRQLIWTRLLIVGLGGVWLISLVSFLLNRHQGAPPHLVFWALALFVYVMGYLGLTRTSVFSQPEMEVLKQTLQPKYHKSGLSPAESAAIYETIVAYVDRERAYLDGELSLQKLAAQLALSPNHASQAINEFENRNFRDFLNKRRVDEACRRLRERSDANLLALAFEVGFSSKSSFNRAFRKFTGSTPSEFAAGN
jgi:AraC-like DNA-binding protein